MFATHHAPSLASSSRRAAGAAALAPPRPALARSPRSWRPRPGWRGSRRLAARRVVRAASGSSDDESLLDKLNPFKAIKKQQEKTAIEKRKADANAVISDDMRKEIFGDGIVGRLASGLINKAASSLKEQMDTMAASTEVTYDAAQRAVCNDARCRRALGEDINVTPPMSQSNNSQSLNGRTVQTTIVGFVAQGMRTGKQAQVQASSTTDADGEFTVDVRVTVVGSGEVIELVDVTRRGDYDAGPGAAATDTTAAAEAAAPFDRGDVMIAEFEDAGPGAGAGAAAGAESAMDAGGGTIDVDAEDVKDA